jgi:hypothetical protein
MKEVRSMFTEALADKLLDLSKKHASEIAELWYKAVSTNPRTTSYSSLNKDTLINQSASFYRNLKQFFFSDNPYSDMERFLETNGYADYAYGHKVPLCEAIYALIIMRRYIWLHADTQAMLYNSPLEVYQALESVNRTILLFDYAIYIVTKRYDEMCKKK